MGLLPEDFYRMSIEDFILKSNGFIESRNWLERIARRAAGLIQIPLAGKGSPSIMQQWPIVGDKKFKQEASDYVNQKNLEVLNKHKAGGFEYVLENGKIIERKINLN